MQKPLLSLGEEGTAEDVGGGVSLPGLPGS